MRVSVRVVSPFLAPALVCALTIAETAAVTNTGAPDPAVVETVRAALARRPEVTLVPAEVERRIFRTATPKGIEPPLSVAEKALNRAENAFSAFRLDEAARQLDAADRALAPWIGTPEARELVRSRLSLAVTLAHASRDTAGVDRGVTAYAKTFPGEAPPKGAWPPAIVGKLEGAAPKRTAGLRIESEPPGEVFVDGRAYGTTPVDVGELTPGEHRLIVTAPGFLRADRRVTATAEKDLVRVELEAGLGGVLEAASAERGLTEAQASALKRAAAAQRIDRLFLVERLPRGGLVIRRLDVSSPGVRVDRVTIASDRGLERAIDRLTRAPVETAPAVARSPENVAFAPSPSPSFQVPSWAWLTIGAGALGVAAGTGLRLDARAGQREVNDRAEVFSQADAFDRKASVDREALAGTVLVGAGIAAIAGVSGWLVHMWLSGDETF